uniref:Uncharacterized protein n=1 Tax=Cacopsylla melanoneura TaxID=428564 RepID=A0A8D8Q029_9HEMI
MSSSVDTTGRDDTSSTEFSSSSSSKYLFSSLSLNTVDLATSPNPTTPPVPFAPDLPTTPAASLDEESTIADRTRSLIKSNLSEGFGVTVEASVATSGRERRGSTGRSGGSGDSLPSSHEDRKEEGPEGR